LVGGESGAVGSGAGEPVAGGGGVGGGGGHFAIKGKHAGFRIDSTDKSTSRSGQ
jgi:hypothetical protein